MKNLLSLKDLSNEEIMDLIYETKKFKEGSTYSLKGKIIANLFFEPSTRTQYSFNFAEKFLDMKIINFNPQLSSLNKGESFYDTVKTIESFGVDALVIRHTQNNYFDELKSLKCPIINAGDGTQNHPSQSLLDLYTIYEEFGHFEGLKIALVGDIMHSRVAHGNIEVMERLGMKCYTSGPIEYKDDNYEYIDFNSCIEEMDIIMLLRVQNERHEKLNMTNDQYLKKYGMTMDKVAKMKEKSIIMHPAPFNRGVEIADDVVECSKSRIFKQMENGVHMRKSIIKRSLGE